MPKVSSSIKLQCEHCQFVRRRYKGGKRVLRVICKHDKRHNRRQG